jgi:hypothetical protein
MSPITTIEVDRTVADDVRQLADRKGMKLKRLTTDLIRLGLEVYVKTDRPLGLPVDPTNDGQPGAFSNPSNARGR